jgi:hypothetical protein
MKENSLLEVLNSRFFREIRSLEPLSENQCRPCMLIDEPAQRRDIALNYARRFTHPDAELLFAELADQIDDYASQFKPFADAAWEEFQRNKMNKGRVAAGYNA